MADEIGWTAFVQNRMNALGLIPEKSSAYMALSRLLGLASSTTHYWFHPDGGRPSIKQLYRLRDLLQIEANSEAESQLYRLWIGRRTRQQAS